MDSSTQAIIDWLATYRDDVARVRAAMRSPAPSPRARYALAGALNYQLRRMDLAPDWTPLVGMADDVMALRTGASVFRINNLLELPPDVAGTVDQLVQQDELVKQLLGELYDPFFQHIRSLVERPVHGRVPEDIVNDAATAKRFDRDLDEMLEAYSPPQIDDSQALQRELVSYFEAKLER